MPYHLDFKFILKQCRWKKGYNLQKRLKDGIKSLNTKEKSFKKKKKMIEQRKEFPKKNI